MKAFYGGVNGTSSALLITSSYMLRTEKIILLLPSSFCSTLVMLSSFVIAINFNSFGSPKDRFKHTW